MSEQAIAGYPVHAREPLPPNESAPVPFRVSRAGRVVDVVDLPPNVAVVQARLGRVRYNREEMKSSLAEFLALESQEVKAGTYCVFTVMNVGAKPVEVTGRVVVEGEHGAAVEGLPLREASDDNERPVYGRGGAASEASVSSRNARNAANDARVDAIIDNATMADGTQVSKAKPSKSKSSKSTGTPSPMPRGVHKPQKIMTRHARRQRYAADATVAKTIALGETRAVLFHIGHVAMLDLALSARVPLDEGVRGEIIAAIREAGETDTSPPADATPAGTRAAVHFSEVDCERLLEALDARVEHTLDDTEGMRAAIDQAATPDNERAAVAAERSESEASVSDAASAHETAPEAVLEASTPSAAETAEPPARVEEAEVGNVTPIHGKVQDDGRPQSRHSAPAKSVVNEV